MPKQLTFLLGALFLGLTAMACEGLETVLTPEPASIAFPSQAPTYTPFPAPGGSDATEAAPTIGAPTIVASTIASPTSVPAPTAEPDPAPAPTAVTMVPYYQDEDGDGFGGPANFILSDLPPPGYVTNDADCDDTDDGIYPEAVEFRDGKDNDCDGEIDEDFESVSYYSDNVIETVLPPAGYVTNNGDCDDQDGSINPDAFELMDGLDNDCDGQADEVPTSTIYFVDEDGDGYGSLQDVIVALTPPPGYVSNAGDCDDADSTVNPGAFEMLDDIDHNCNGIPDG